MFCPRCGAENPDNGTLCKRCRQPLAVTALAIAQAWAIAQRVRRNHS